MLSSHQTIQICKIQKYLQRECVKVLNVPSQLVLNTPVFLILMAPINMRKSLPVA